MTITGEFQKIALQHPENIALVSETEGSFSYQQLEEYSNYIANELLSDKERIGVVGILLNRSFSLIAAMIGIMKAGMAYLPLDPSYPLDRLNWMLASSKT